MFKRIMAPVDLHHADDLIPALDLAAELAKLHGAEIVYVGVGSNAPGDLGRTPEAYAERLEAFARERTEKTGVQGHAHPALSHDPTSDLDKRLLEAVEETGADLVVMQTHRPGWADHWFGSHGGKVASHAPVSVLLVR